MATERQIEANRKNAARSSGPKTTQGKERSRGNALKHGFCSQVVDHPDDAPGSAKVAGLDGWLRTQVALAGTKIDRCQAMERAARSRIVARASVTWDEDRKGEAIRLGSELADRPEEVVAQLRETLHGCQWLITRWALLAHSADSHNSWTPEQVRLAFDLFGTPSEFREGRPPGTWIDYHGKLVEPTPGPAVVARRAIKELMERCETLRPLDQANREQAQADLSDDDPEIRRLRRYEAELHRRMKWSLEQIQGPSTAVEPGSNPKPEPEPGSNPKIEPEPIPTPIAQIPQTPSRAERRLIKAESRREAKRRKLENLRA